MAQAAGKQENFGPPSTARPRVSVGLPVYNGAGFLAGAIESLLAQTFTDFELILSDNASTDSTQQIGLAYAAKDARVRYHRNETNIGASGNHNRTIELCRGEYFLWFGHDDLCAPTYLARCVEVLDRDPGLVLVSTRITDVDETGSAMVNENVQRGIAVRADQMAIDATEPHRRFAALSSLNHQCELIFGMMRSAVLKQTRLHGNYADADRVLLAELALRGRFALIPDTLFFRREHAHRSTRLHPGRHERSVWMDPNNAGRLLFPHCREFREFVRAIAGAPVARRERLRCYATILRWPFRYWRRILDEFRTAARTIAIKILPGPVREAFKKMMDRGYA